MNHPKFTSAPQHNFFVAFLLQIINGISDPIFVKDRQHRWVLLNDAFCDFMGHSREELLGKSDYDFFPKQEADVFWDTDELVFTTGITNENDEDFTDVFGVTHVISTNKSLFEDETGKKFLVGTIRDITRNVAKYKRVEAELGQSQQLLQLVMDNIPQQIFWKDCNLVYMGCNRNFARVAGVGLPENIIGKTDYDLAWKKEESDWYRECDRRVMESGKPELHIIETQQQADGKQSWSDTNKIPLHDAQGNVIGILSTYEDITERKHAEEALKQSEAKLQLAYAELETLVLVRTKQLAQINEALQAKIAEHEQTEAALRESEAKLQKLAASVPGMLYQFLLQPDGSMFFTYVSSGSYEIYGLQPEEIQADANLIISVIHPDDRQHFEESVAVSAQTLQPWQWEGRFVLSSGQVKWLKGASRPEAQANGTILWYGLLLDITERKQADLALIRSHAVLQAQQEAAIDGILVVDENRKIVSYNQRLIQLWQIPQEVIQTGDYQQLFAWALHKLKNPEQIRANVEYLYQHPEKLGSPITPTSERTRASARPTATYPNSISSKREDVQPRTTCCGHCPRNQQPS